ncbi:hypothetical protein G7Z17_g2372 [Cylindrodendrum hubeiense]|uniref:Uncharacterized protein n=1 Tax=Cylindrodendrum hubeiense TaxID=595255 RepID=A0A9P5HJV6_9HYPO|nr:hypothetical protein G7Z17_g2372 [Cylindrodendrum hubeiense]
MISHRRPRRYRHWRKSRRRRSGLYPDRYVPAHRRLVLDDGLYPDRYVPDDSATLRHERHPAARSRVKPPYDASAMNLQERRVDSHAPSRPHSNLADDSCNDPHTVTEPTCQLPCTFPVMDTEFKGQIGTLLVSDSGSCTFVFNSESEGRYLGTRPSRNENLSPLEEEEDDDSTPTVLASPGPVGCSEMDTDGSEMDIDLFFDALNAGNDNTDDAASSLHCCLCNSASHNVLGCLRTDDAGFTLACPWCMDSTHPADVCSGFAAASYEERVDRLVTERGNMPPFYTLQPWFTLVQQHQALDPHAPLPNFFP